MAVAAALVRLRAALPSAYPTFAALSNFRATVRDCYEPTPEWIAPCRGISGTASVLRS
jgi:hypothetical protein